MTDWKYTDSTNINVLRILDSGVCESCVATRADVVAWVAAGNSIAAADAAPVSIPDLATQLAAALIAKGTLAVSDFHVDTLADVNAQLADAGQAQIAVKG